MTAAPVVLADAGDAGVDRLAAVHVLHRRLPEQEVDKVLCLEGAHKVGLGQPHRVVLKRIVHIYTLHMYKQGTSTGVQ